MNENENDSAVETYIYQEVVNRAEKERRSKIKADYIKKHGKQSDDDTVRYTPKKRDSYKKSHDMHEKEKMDGERDITAKDTMGYTRLYGKDGKRDSSGYGDSQYKGTPSRDKDGVFKKRSNWDAMFSRGYHTPLIKAQAWGNKLAHQEKEDTKDVPHKDKIDKIANKIRDKYMENNKKTYERVMNSKAPKIIKQYVDSPESRYQSSLNSLNLKNIYGDKEFHRNANYASSGVHAAYAADRAISKGTKKAKEVAKKFVANKLKHNRSAKSENTDLFDFIDDDWYNDL